MQIIAGLGLLPPQLLLRPLAAGLKGLKMSHKNHVSYSLLSPIAFLQYIPTKVDISMSTDPPSEHSPLLDPEASIEQPRSSVYAHPHYVLRLVILISTCAFSLGSFLYSLARLDIRYSLMCLIVCFLFWIFRPAFPSISQLQSFIG